MAIAMHLENGHGHGEPREQYLGGLWEQVVVPRKILDKCAEEGWLISTAEIAKIIGLDSGSITKRGDRFDHEIWSFERVRREGNQYIWAISRTQITTQPTDRHPSD